MARSFHHSLLSAVVALIVGGSALAQDSLLKEAVTSIRLGNAEEAKAKLQEILAADPSNSEALAMYQTVSQDEWLMLISDSDGQIRQAAQSILDRAKAERRQLSRDVVAIQDLVDAAVDGSLAHGDRQGAINKLITDYGEFAVPALVAKLGDADNEDGQNRAIYALSQLRGAAVLPLIEALKINDDLIVQNATAALNQIGDRRAAPAMAHLARDSRVAVNSIAKKFLAANGVQGNDVTLQLAQARNYLANGVPAAAQSDVVWSLQNGHLVATDVPALIYPAELAKSCAADAVAIAPQNDDAVGILAEANMHQVTLIEDALAKGDESVDGVADMVPELKIAAHAAGSKSIVKIIEAANDKNSGVFIQDAMAFLPQSPESQDALIKALASTDKRVSYAAATALVKASEGAEIPSSDKVVKVLAEAVTEEAVRTIQVISPDNDTKNAVVAANSVRGLAVDASGTAVRGMQNLLLDASIDAVVINEILPDRSPEDIIGLMKRDSRMAQVKVIIVAKDTDAAEERFGERVDGVLQAPLTGEALVAEVNRVLEGVADPAGDTAEGYAAQASNALLAVAARAGNVNAALSNLQLQLNRGDAVAVPAARTLGFAGSALHLEVLASALKGGSEGVQVASAEAMGRILSRLKACPKGAFDALMVAVKGKGSVDLRTAAAMALGQAKLNAGQKAEVQKKLRRIAGSSNES